MDTFLQNCLNGLSIGSIYALIAIGYTMVYGILRLINFAHGDIFMMAGYFMIICMTDLLIPWYISIIIVIIATIILGVVIEKVAYKPLRDAPRMSIMISAIGVSYLLENLATYIFSAQPKSYPYDKMGFLSQGHAGQHLHHAGDLHHPGADHTAGHRPGDTHQKDQDRHGHARRVPGF
jgi:branched-chain amino acid transport system permease protein